jgi:uncharacterized protein with HEPN domain
MSRDLTYLVDILQFARKIQHDTRDIAKEDFLQDETLHNAAIYQFIIIGEATKRLSAEFRDQHPSIPWKKMAGMRDVLIHSYSDVDLELVWEAAMQSIPDLIAQIETLIPPEESGNP